MHDKKSAKSLSANRDNLTDGRISGSENISNDKVDVDDTMSERKAYDGSLKDLFKFLGLQIEPKLEPDHQDMNSSLKKSHRPLMAV